MDPRAAEIVLASGIPVVLVPFELTSTVTISQSDLDLIRDAETESSQYVFEGCKKWMTFWRENFPSDDGFHPWDSATIAYLTSRELFVPEVRGFRIRSVDGMAHGVGNAKTGKLSESQRWLELSPDFPNGQIEYITRFRNGGGKKFVRQIVESVY
jgi:inosine-uridine nucleoside N-ribohydrolase